MKRLLTDLAPSALLGLGMVFLASPLLLFWWIHGSYERYERIIGGPSPYDMFGSGPFQLLMGVGLLLAGGVSVCASLLLRALLWRAR